MGRREGQMKGKVGALEGEQEPIKLSVTEAEDPHPKPLVSRQSPPGTDKRGGLGGGAKVPDSITNVALQALTLSGVRITCISTSEL